MLNRKLLYFLSSQLMCTGQAEIYLMLNTVSNSYEQIDLHNLCAQGKLKYI